MSYKYFLIRHNLFTPSVIGSFAEFPSCQLIKLAIDGYDFIDVSLENSQRIAEGEHVCPHLALTYFIEKDLKC